MGFFTPKHSWANVTARPREDADFTKGKLVSHKQGKKHAARHNNPSEFKKRKNKG
jgi:hypothetical protein